MRRASRVCAGAGAAAVLLLTASSARSDDPVTSAVRFNREIVRIFDRKCVSCHSPAGIAMSLATYRDVRPWARAIREEIVEQRMPPTSAVRGFARLKDDIALTPRELSTILTWVDGGVPRGDESDLPAAHSTPAAAEPDVRLALPPQQIPGDGQDLVRQLTVATGLAEGRWLRQVRIRPGNSRLLRAAFVSILREGQPPVWAGSWTPWQTDVSPAPPGAWLLRRGSRLSIELHYRGQDAATVDSSEIGLFFAPEGEWRDLTSIVLTPATPNGHRERHASPVRAETTLEHDSVLWGGRIEVAADGSSVEVAARRPDGSIDVLLWVPKLNAVWPAPFIFMDPVALPAGTVISATNAGGTAAVRPRIILTLHPAS